MEDRYSITTRQRSGIWKSLRDEEFEEEEVWDVLKTKHDYSSGVGKPKDKKPSCLFAPRSISTAAKMIPRSTSTSTSSKNNSCSSSTHEANFLPQSAPVNIPHWSKIHRNNRNKASKNVSRFDNNDLCGGHYVDDDEDECVGGDSDDDGDSKLPPHEFIAKRIAKSSFSVLEGAGRTLKGRDLSEVRNAVLTRTGFLE